MAKYDPVEAAKRNQKGQPAATQDVTAVVPKAPAPPQPEDPKMAVQPSLGDLLGEGAVAEGQDGGAEAAGEPGPKETVPGEAAAKASSALLGEPEAVAVTPAKPAPAGSTTALAEPLAREYRVTKGGQISWAGGLTNLPTGSIVHLAGYGPNGLKSLVTQGIVLEPLPPAAPAEPSDSLVNT